MRVWQDMLEFIDDIISKCHGLSRRDVECCQRQKRHYVWSCQVVNFFICIFLFEQNECVCSVNFIITEFHLLPVFTWILLFGLGFVLGLNQFICLKDKIDI